MKRMNEGSKEHVDAVCMCAQTIFVEKVEASVPASVAVNVLLCLAREIVAVNQQHVQSEANKVQKCIHSHTKNSSFFLLLFLCRTVWGEWVECTPRPLRLQSVTHLRRMGCALSTRIDGTPYVLVGSKTRNMVAHTHACAFVYTHC